MSYLAIPPLGRRTLVSGLLVAALAVGLSACGSSGSSTGASASTGTQFQARLSLAKCFRAHGLNVPDPSSGGGPAGGGGGVFRALRTYPEAQVTAATQACRQYFAQAFPQLNLSPAQRAQRQQQLVKLAECMRSHGINLPDPTPTPGPGGGGFGIGRQLRSLDNNPAFQTALKSCASLRPRFGRGGGGGGFGGPPGGGPPGGGAPGA